MKSIATILFLVATIASTVWAGDVTQQDVIMARRDAERVARDAVRVAQNKIALIPGIPRARFDGARFAEYSELNNATFVIYMEEQNALLREQVLLLTRIANVLATVASTNVVQKLEKE